MRKKAVSSSEEVLWIISIKEMSHGDWSLQSQDRHMIESTLQTKLAKHCISIPSCPFCSHGSHDESNLSSCLLSLYSA